MSRSRSTMGGRSTMGPQGSQFQSATSIPRFCETTSRDNPNTEAFYGMMREIECMFQKLASDTGSGLSGFQSEYNKLIEEIRRMEDLIATLERQIDRLKDDLGEANADVGDEIQRRKELEQIVANLRSELDKLDRDLCLALADRDRLLSHIDSLNKQLDSWRNKHVEVIRERDELVEKIRTSEGRPSSRHDRQPLAPVTREDLQVALADCCMKVDDLTKQIGLLNADINKLRRDLDEALKERDDLLSRLDDLQDKYDQARALNDEIIGKFQEEVRCLEREREDNCEKFKGILQKHHEELDRLQAEKEKLEGMYCAEKAAKEVLQMRLDDCEKKNKRLCKGGGSGGGGSGGGGGGPGGGGGKGGGGKGGALGTDKGTDCPPGQSQKDSKGSQCDNLKDEINQLLREKANLERSRQCLEQQVETQSLDLDALTSQLAKSKEGRSILHSRLAEVEKAKLEQEEDHDATVRDLQNTHAQQLKALKDQLLRRDENDNTTARKTTSVHKSSNTNETKGLLVVHDDLDDPNNNKVNASVGTLPQGLEDDESLELIRQRRTLRQDVRNLKKHLSEKDSQISSLETMVKSVKAKYVDQYNQMKDERVRLDKERDELAKKDVALKETLAEIETEVEGFRESQRALEMDKEAHEATLKAFKKEKANIEKWARTKAQLEEEISTLKTNIMNQFVDKDVISSVKAQFEVHIADLKNKLDAQAEINNELAEVNAALGQKARVQENMIRIKTSSEDTLRKELDSLMKAYKTEVELVKRALEEKDEELATLREAMAQLKGRYLATSKANGRLMKQIEDIEEVTHEDTTTDEITPNNNNNVHSSSTSQSSDDRRNLSRTISQNKDYVKML